MVKINSLLPQRSHNSNETSVYESLMIIESKYKDNIIDFHQCIKCITELFAKNLGITASNTDFMAYSTYYSYKRKDGKNSYCDSNSLRQDILTVLHKDSQLKKINGEIPVENGDQRVTIKLDIIELPLPKEFEVECTSNGIISFEVSKSVKYIIKHSIKTSCITVYFESPTNKYIYPKKEFKINGKENQNFIHQEISSWMIDTLNSSNNI